MGENISERLGRVISMLRNSQVEIESVGLKNLLLAPSLLPPAPKVVPIATNDVSDALQAKIAVLEDKNKSVNAELAQLRESVASTRSDGTDTKLLNQTTALQQLVDDLRKKIAVSEVTIDTQNTQLQMSNSIRDRVNQLTLELDTMTKKQEATATLLATRTKELEYMTTKRDHATQAKFEAEMARDKIHEELKMLRAEHLAEGEQRGDQTALRMELQNAREMVDAQEKAAVSAQKMVAAIARETGTTTEERDIFRERSELYQKMIAEAETRSEKSKLENMKLREERNQAVIENEDLKQAVQQKDKALEEAQQIVQTLTSAANMKSDELANMQKAQLQANNNLRLATERCEAFESQNRQLESRVSELENQAKGGSSEVELLQQRDDDKKLIQQLTDKINREKEKRRQAVEELLLKIATLETKLEQTTTAAANVAAATDGSHGSPTTASASAVQATSNETLHANASDHTIDEVQGYLSQARAQLAEVKSELETEKGARAAISEELSAAKANIERMKARILADKETIANHISQTSDLLKSRDAILRERDAYKAEVASIQKGVKSQETGVHKKEEEYWELDQRFKTLDQKFKSAALEADRERVELSNEIQDLQRENRRLSGEIIAFKQELVSRPTSEDVEKLKAQIGGQLKDALAAKESDREKYEERLALLTRENENLAQYKNNRALEEVLNGLTPAQLQALLAGTS